MWAVAVVDIAVDRAGEVNHASIYYFTEISKYVLVDSAEGSLRIWKSCRVSRSSDLGEMEISYISTSFKPMSRGIGGGETDEAQKDNVASLNFAPFNFRIYSRSSISQ